MPVREAFDTLGALASREVNTTMCARLRSVTLHSVTCPLMPPWHALSVTAADPSGHHQQDYSRLDTLGRSTGYATPRPIMNPNNLSTAPRLCLQKYGRVMLGPAALRLAAVKQKTDTTTGRRGGQGTACQRPSPTPRRRDQQCTKTALLRHPSHHQRTANLAAVDPPKRRWQPSIGACRHITSGPRHRWSR